MAESSYNTTGSPLQNQTSSKLNGSGTSLGVRKVEMVSTHPLAVKTVSCTLWTTSFCNSTQVSGENPTIPPSSKFHSYQTIFDPAVVKELSLKHVGIVKHPISYVKFAVGSSSTKVSKTTTWLVSIPTLYIPFTV